MKRLAYLILPILLPTVARASPNDPDTYLQLGLLTGGAHSQQDYNTSFFALEIALAAGHRVSDLVWVHGVIGAGALTDFDESAGNLLDVRGGVQLRSCVSSGIVCGLASIDAGVRRGHVNAEFDHINATALLIAPQLALDVGTSHVRIRPAIEADLGTDLSGLALSLSAAYAW